MDPMSAGATAAVPIFAGMITAQILSHFDLIITNPNGSKTWKCKGCGKDIVSSGDQKLKYHVGQVQNGGVATCPNPHPEMSLIYRKEIETTVNAKRASDTGAGGAGTSPSERGQPGIACASDDKPPLKRGSADMTPEALPSAAKITAASLPLTKVPGGGNTKLAVLKEQAMNSASLAASNASLALVAQSTLKMEAGQRLVDALAADISELTSEIKDLPAGDPSLPAMQKELADLKDRRGAAKKQRLDYCKNLAS
jgi:hypothetical protein